MFNKLLQNKIQTSTEMQLHQYYISIQLVGKVKLIAKCEVYEIILFFYC